MVNTHPMRLGIEGKLPLVCASYTWETPGHPDPNGEQITALAAAIEAEQTREDPKQCLSAEVADFMGWPCLCQKDADGQRTGNEQAAYSGAVRHMQVWYSMVCAQADDRVPAAQAHTKCSIVT
jgi:hypothetical protein